MADNDIAARGSLACVGLGLMLGAHLSPRARAHIEQADVVYAAVADPLVELWLQQMHADVRSLQPLYAAGKSRHQTYREMVAAMLAEVRAGRRVCGAFYGHPGVFAQAPHLAIAQARAEGYAAVMEPGISAEDCLYADLGIDPGRYGCQHFEATQLMLYQRRIDPSAYLVLWQIGLAGDHKAGRFTTDAARLRLLLEILSADYPASHEVIVYEAATLAIAAPRIERVPLGRLPELTLRMQSTLILPPCRALLRNQHVRDQLEALDREASVA